MLLMRYEQVFTFEAFYISQFQLLYIKVKNGYNITYENN